MGADLTVRFAEACELECVDDVAHVWVHPGNAGEVAVERPVVVEVVGFVAGIEEVVASQVVTEPLPAGQELKALGFEVPDLSRYERLTARIRTDDWYFEGCDTAPDAVDIPALCAGE